MACTGASAIPAAQVHRCWMQSCTQHSPLHWVSAEHRANTLASIPASRLTLERVCSTPCQRCDFSTSSVSTAIRSQRKSSTSSDSPLKAHDAD